ncbi:MAG: ATP-binding protein [Deferrisomatales bacterium]|nr:ATP-binding protein [Deferrisomatales bacterium]
MTPAVKRVRVDEPSIEHLLGLESSKIGFYAEVKQKIRELESTNLDLRTKKSELQAVFDSIRDGLAIFGEDRRVQSRNHVCPRLLPRETAMGTPCRELFHADREESPEGCPVELALRGENRESSFATAHGGRIRYFEASATPIRDPFGRPSRALVFLREVTERRLQELQLLQAEKMSSVGVLAAGVAHEINNPLTSVAGYAEALVRRLREHPELSADPRLEAFPTYLEVVVRETYRCKAIIESLLSFSRRSDGSMGPVDLGSLTLEVTELVCHQARYDAVEILTDLERSAPPIRGDAASLRQVFLNLTINAVQAVGSAGTVELSVRPDGDQVVFRCRDTGPGISPEVLDKIWQPFFTTKAVGQGLGLGLAVTYNIVERHGGHIGVESRPGQGADFTVRLPVWRES